MWIGSYYSISLERKRIFEIFGSWVECAFSILSYFYFCVWLFPFPSMAIPLFENDSVFWRKNYNSPSCPQRLLDFMSSTFLGVSWIDCVLVHSTALQQNFMGRLGSSFGFVEETLTIFTPLFLVPTVQCCWIKGNQL